ncbi:MAG: Fe-S protein assembly co-chaperone HscB [Bryobacterales bacterium]|nr:Fe-S protein assembly co-chaperone HscB [Bryobacterales bacterium]
MDYFEILGIDRRLSLDVDFLQKRFYQLSREYHPDRFASKPAAERAQAEQKSALLNDAWRTLRDPLQRIEYLLKLEGLDVVEQRTKDVPPELLEEVFELNMALEEARMGDEDARGELAGMRDHFLQLRQAIDAELQQLSAEYDAAPGSPKLQQIRGVMNRRSYIRNLVNEVEKELAPSGQNTPA